MQESHVNSSTRFEDPQTPYKLTSTYDDKSLLLRRLPRHVTDDTKLHAQMETNELHECR